MRSAFPSVGWRWVAGGVLLGCHSVLAAAAESSPPRMDTPSLTFSFFRVVGALAVVVALLLGGVWLFRNWQRLAVPRGRAPKLNVLEYRSLGPRHALYVIGYEQQRFLLSCGPTGVTMLTALPVATATEADLGPAAPANFAETLAKALSPVLGRAGDPR